MSGFLESKAWGQELMPIAVLGRVTPGSRREEGMEVKQGRRQSWSQDVWSTWLPLGALERLPYPQGVSFTMAYKMQLRTAGPRGIGGRIYPQAPVSYWLVSTPKGCTHTHTHTHTHTNTHKSRAIGIPHFDGLREAPGQEARCVQHGHEARRRQAPPWRSWSQRMQSSLPLQWLE